MKMRFLLITGLLASAMLAQELPDAPLPKDSTSKQSVTVLAAPTIPQDKFLSTSHLLMFYASATSLAGQAGMDCSNQAPTLTAVPLTKKQCTNIIIGAAAVLAVEVSLFSPTVRQDAPYNGVRGGKIWPVRTLRRKPLIGYSRGWTLTGNRQASAMNAFAEN